ncbi:hypothetical protein BRE01_55560 [Brevibacillus reuszeri]|uniref:DUF4261 domain-containing protein n=1 Tax=Brevibacillus reuszeri TaxID=54915 RepID=A0A0K9YNY4_9BACL|nr:DUF4261 domain-containing protein [Brevibacillus reuszeri]KNB70438.1 hypothetical protein ADS79_16020 [Brevibacillus reuszeri]MED1857977.1 DUF4261 domain-containing protein [Brevibacillus reuszeri]GED71854.1 hypothetical protein BRE01_55560 [Brevibacillus reuszeri]
MPKGLYSQGVAILLSKSVTIQQIAEALQQKFAIMNVNESSEQWVFSGPSLLIPFRPEDNGYIQVDVVDRQWPDEMGDPAGDTMLFGAWTMGFFGPFTYPNNLERAAQQAWGYPEGRQAAAEHTAFIRVRSSFTLGQTDEQAPVLPEDYDPFTELLALNSVSETLLQMPESLCYFNPNGESLASADTMQEMKQRFEEIELPPLELWSNVRLFNLPEDWLMMDTVGMLQLDAIDHEAIFHGQMYDPNEVASFLRNIANYVYENGPVIKDGDTTDGPGEIYWKGVLLDESLTNPPRQVIRWYPLDEKEKPAGLE